MNFTLHQLAIFSAVARTGSISRAAEEMLLTQPAVSMQIKALERTVGLPLLVRVGKHLELTDAGRDLETRATRILGLTQETAEAMTERREGRQGRLRIIATTTVGIYTVPSLLGAYHRRHPDVEISLAVENWETTRDRLLAGEADIAIAGTKPEEELIWEPFMEDELVVIASANHHLARRTLVTLEDLSREPFLLRERGSGTRAAVEELFAEHNLPLKRAMELSRNGAIKQVAREGLGVAVISIGAIELELRLGQLCDLPVEGFPIVRQWYLIRRSGYDLSPAAAGFWREVRGDLPGYPRGRRDSASSTWAILGD